MSEHSGYQALWRDPGSIGQFVRELHLRRGDDFGSIRIQMMRKDYARVCSFLPGVEECSPGDTPKIWPEKQDYATSNYSADTIFDTYVQEAYAEGWQNDNSKS